ADPDGRLALGDEEIPEHPAGEAPDPFEVTSGQRVSFRGLIEALGRVLPDRFEEPKPSTRGSWNPRQERAFDELLEEVDDLTARELVVRDGVFSRVPGEASSEDSEASEHDPLIEVEEVVAPVEGCSQGALARGCGSFAARKDAELVSQAV